jgi:hypothetical protein
VEIGEVLSYVLHDIVSSSFDKKKEDPCRIPFFSRDSF